MNYNESKKWTLDTRLKLMNKNFMLSRPLFNDRYYLRVVLGNYNTSMNRINELLKLIN